MPGAQIINAAPLCENERMAESKPATVELPDAEELAACTDSELSRIWRMARDARDRFAEVWFCVESADAGVARKAALRAWHPLLRQIEEQMRSRDIGVPSAPPENRLRCSELDEWTGFAA